MILKSPPGTVRSHVERAAPVVMADGALHHDVTSADAVIKMPELGDFRSNLGFDSFVEGEISCCDLQLGLHVPPLKIRTRYGPASKVGDLPRGFDRDLLGHSFVEQRYRDFHHAVLERGPGLVGLRSLGQYRASFEFAVRNFGPKVVFLFDLLVFLASGLDRTC